VAIIRYTARDDAHDHWLTLRAVLEAELRPQILAHSGQQRSGVEGSGKRHLHPGAQGKPLISRGKERAWRVIFGRGASGITEPVGRGARLDGQMLLRIHSPIDRIVTPGESGWNGRQVNVGHSCRSSMRASRSVSSVVASASVSGA